MDRAFAPGTLNSDDVDIGEAVEPLKWPSVRPPTVRPPPPCCGFWAFTKCIFRQPIPVLDLLKLFFCGCPYEEEKKSKINFSPSQKWVSENPPCMKGLNIYNELN